MHPVEHVLFTLPLADFKQLLTQIVRQEVQAISVARSDKEHANLLTIKEACVFLGVSRPTIYALMKSGKLKHVYLSKNRLRFTKAYLVEYVEKSRYNTR